jgi:hypothetical protein
VRLHYVLWQSLRYMRHQAVYYITYKKLMWLNGRGLDQMEFVMPMVSGVPLGIEATGRGFTVHMKLQLIRDALLVFPCCRYDVGLCNKLLLIYTLNQFHRSYTFRISSACAYHMIPQHS